MVDQRLPIGVHRFDLTHHSDARGALTEIFRACEVPDFHPVQVNVSVKRLDAIVGLHYHLKQADFWVPLRGCLRVILHDLRVGSPTEGTTWCGEMVKAQAALYIPPGVAHGFSVLTDEASLLYLVDRYYDPTDELGLAWNDSQIDADWRIAAPILSERDRRNPPRRAIAERDLPRYGDL